MLPLSDYPATSAEQLNRSCRCQSLDHQALMAELAETAGDLYRQVTEERPHLFAESAVFVSETCLARQRAIIEALERAIALPAYREQVMAYAPSSARVPVKASGVFLGYDFHLAAGGPKLIEINTNAGGALINALLIRAQAACCDLADNRQPGLSCLHQPAGMQADRMFLEMFYQEWRAERGERPLRRIAIVDDHPQTQYLWPEFVLFQRLFQRHGIDAVICDPAELHYRDGALRLDDHAIDLVYNRLTDFALAEPKQQALLEAYADQAVVVTPHPYGHALYADKRNLSLLCDGGFLASIGVDAETRTLLQAGIAETAIVSARQADTLWAARKGLFFKPARGFGSKAAYRGDKLTKRVFDEILQHDYVAQQLVRPSERQLDVGNEVVDLKLDLRHYVYRGQTQLVCARLYQGQTTNFRTPGGGFAQVVAVP